MKNLKIYLLVLAVMLLSAGCSSEILNPQKSKKEHDPDKPLSTHEYQKMLKVGMDVDWCKTNPGRTAYQKAHTNGINVAQLFKDRGFSHVRIRLKDSVITDPTLLDELKVMIDDCIKADIIPIIAYQAYDFKIDPASDDAIDDVVKWWEKIANAFKDYPYIVSYNLIIETTEEVKNHNDRLNLLYKKTADALHKIDENRILIIAPNKISDPYELKNLEVPQPNTYIMAEFHFYAAGPQKENKRTDRKIWNGATDGDKKRVTDRVDEANKWSKANNIPVWVGAWMANDYNTQNAIQSGTLSDGAPWGGNYNIQEQIEFANFMRESFEDKGIPYAVNSDTKYFNRDTNQWYDSVSDVLDAILGK